MPFNITFGGQPSYNKMYMKEITRNSVPVNTVEQNEETPKTMTFGQRVPYVTKK